MNILILLSLLNLFCFSGPEILSEAHEFHLSKCEVVYSEQDRALQITLHIFIDDLELALEKQGNKGLFLATERENVAADSLLYTYLQKEFQLAANGLQLPYNFIGKEPSSDLLAIWCYLEVEDFIPQENLTVKNHILLDIYDDQKNIVSIKMPGKKGGYFMMEKDNYEQTFKLQ